LVRKFTIPALWVSEEKEDPVDTVADAGTEGLTQWRETTIQELLEKYQIESADTGNPYIGHGSYIIVSERGGQATLLAEPNIDRGSALQEIGYTSMSPWTAWTREELNPELRDKLGIRKWYDMKRQDGAVRGALRLLKTPIQAARWFVQPASKSALDVNIAAFVEKCLFKDLNVDFSQFLDDVLLMFDYGYMVFEKVYKFNKDGKVVLRKLAPRHPLDIREWVFDDNGGPAGIIMEPFVPYNGLSGFSNPSPQFDSTGLSINLGAFIPINKLAVFSLEPEAGDLRGISVLRSAYKHWYYKDTLYKIDAIQKERHGIGVPVIKLPPGFTAEDKRLAEELGRNLRTNDRAHIVIPANWEIMFAILEGQPVSCIESIEHHNSQISTNILAPFMEDSNAGTDSVDMFFKSTRYLAGSVSNIVNKHIIEQLVDLNFARGQYPTLRARRIGEWNDLRTWSFAFRNLVGSNAIIPDDPLEIFLRDELDLPAPDPETARPILAPQAANNDGGDGTGDTNAPGAPKPPRVGLPRQKPRPPVAPPRANAGRDGNGGG
jgi:hypothetical protein